MPSYSPIKRWMDSAEKARTATRLLALRHKLRSEIGDRAGRNSNSLFIATWNLRDFDTNRLGHGARLREALYYIAEIVSAFDLVVIQEAGRNLDPLETMLGILGHEWDYLASDTVEDDTGRDQRMVFLYRKSKLGFRRIWGEVALPGGYMVAPRSGIADPRKAGELQFVRAPFMAAFQADGFKFNLCTLHLRYGGHTAASLERHIAQLEGIARFFRERQDREREDYILIGDFGVGAPSDIVAKSLERAGFDVPEALVKRRLGLDGDKAHYDQIAFRAKPDRLELVRAGTFRFFDAVFRDNDEDFAAYEKSMPEEKANDLWNGGPRGYYAAQWRTWQMSNHLPLWVELKVDFSDHDLETIRRNASQS